jgi:hypothetical protein
MEAMGRVETSLKRSPAYMALAQHFSLDVRSPVGQACLPRNQPLFSGQALL